MTRKLYAGQYLSRDELKSDVDLMVDNCCYFNDPASPYVFSCFCSLRLPLVATLGSPSVSGREGGQPPLIPVLLVFSRNVVANHGSTPEDGLGLALALTLTPAPP